MNDNHPTKRISILAALAGLLPAPAPAVDVNRAEVQAYVNELVKEHGLDADYLLAMLDGAQTQQSILDAIARPAEGTKTWREYRAIFLTPERIAAGVAFWNDNEARLARVAEQTGVPPEMLAGIIGVETYFGQRAGKHRLLDSLATLAFDYPPRSAFFRTELTQLFLLARDESLEVDKALGSYAGAMGAPQFMPSSYRNYAVDGDGDGRRDLFRSWDDVLASVANYFVEHKWRPGEPVVTRGTLARPNDHKPADNKLSPGTTVSGLAAQGVRFTTDLDPAAPAGLLAFEGDDGLEYWVGFHNFYVITRYNRSTMYALAVYQLGQAVGEAVRAGQAARSGALTPP
jgi:membrane-bound lytic murein transglycosylase B